MNKLPMARRARIITALVEGNSMRSTSRMEDVSINTVTKLLVDVGQAASEYQDGALRKLPCKRVQVDEIWAFVYAKAKNAAEDMKAAGTAGDIWTWTSICADTKIVPSWLVGNRDGETAKVFISDLADRLASRVQLTSEGNNSYLEAVEGAFGADIDYAQLIKQYGAAPEGQRRYSPAEVTGIKKTIINGNPDESAINTSFVERQNLTMRMGMRRFTRLTNGFSKKVENHAHMVALHFMYYNFARIHKTLRITPAMAAGVSERLWSIEDIVKLAD